MVLAWPGTCAGWESTSSKSTGPTETSAGAVASPILSMPSKPLERRSAVGPTGAPSRETVAVEAIRVLVVAKRSARQARVQGAHPDAPSGLFSPRGAALPAQGLDCHRPGGRRSEVPPHPFDRHGDRRHQGVVVLAGASDQALDDELAELDERIEALLMATVPELLARFGVGPDTAAAL